MDLKSNANLTLDSFLSKWNSSWKVFDKSMHMADILPVCMFFWWPPPKSIYLKTLTNSNYMGPLLWYAIFLSSPAIFDSWADPPPLAHSCLLACCSWHHIQKSSSLSAVLSKKKRDIKRLVQGSVDMNIAEPSLSLRRWVKSLYVRRGEEGKGEVSDPLWPFVCKRDREPSPFPTQRAPRFRLSYWSPSRSHVLPLLCLPRA